MLPLRGQAGRGSPIALAKWWCVEIQASGFHTLALKSDGSVWTWGYNAFGQLGNGNNTNSSLRVRVVDPGDPSGFLTGVTAIAAGGNHSLALKSGGSSVSVPRTHLAPSMTAC